jgi:hypothetical protein
LHIPNLAQREHVFMRWKERFLVPDHRVRTISGASFEGFYYICFNQVTGTVSGIYFHAKSEKCVISRSLSLHSLTKAHLDFNNLNCITWRIVGVLAHWSFANIARKSPLGYAKVVPLRW